VAGSTKAKTAPVSNDAAGIARLVARLGGLMLARVVLEATGGDAFQAACALQATGLAVVDPRRARDIARAMGPLARTGAREARMLAAFARVLHQHPRRERCVKPLTAASC
jgi:transposase